MTSILFTALVFVVPLMAMPETAEILTMPRMATGVFRSEGVFRGGSGEAASLKGLRRDLLPSEGGERWTFDFTDPVTKKAIRLAPEFQVKVVKAESFQRSDGTVVYTEPPKVFILLRGIRSSQLEAAGLAKSLKKSRFVKEIIPYPSIEDGDMGIEMILSREALVSPYHPRHAENQLVLEMK